MSGPAAPAELAFDPAAFGGYTARELKESAFARILLIGPGKIGKTTAVLQTAPGPVCLINCDGDSAPKYAVDQGAEPYIFEVNSRATWKKAHDFAVKSIELGGARTVVVDTLTILAGNIRDELTPLHIDDTLGLYGELKRQLMGGLKRFLKLPAHVFVVCHMTPSSNKLVGILPSIEGSTKEEFPGRVDDWIFMGCDPESKPERYFLLGAQGSWTASGRNIKRATKIPADVPTLFKELGLPL